MPPFLFQALFTFRRLEFKVEETRKKMKLVIFLPKKRIKSLPQISKNETSSFQITDMNNGNS